MQTTPAKQPDSSRAAAVRRANALADTPTYLSAAEAAARYGIGRSTFWAYVAQNKLPPPFKFGARIRRWKTEDLDRAFEQTAQSVA